MKECKICGRTFKFLGKHLPVHEISQKDYYDKYLKTKREGLCKREGCSNPTSFSGLWRGYLATCSKDCFAVYSNYRVVQHNKTTIDPETGLNLSTKLSIERRKKQLVEQRKIDPKTGKPYISAISRKIYNKMSDESREALHRSGGLATMQGFRENGTLQEHQSSISRGYWDNLSENDKSDAINYALSQMFKTRKSVLAGKTWVHNLQGYEHVALTYLLLSHKLRQITVKPECIVLDSGRLYFPDFKIGNTIIEVKSLYTFELDKFLKAKRRAVWREGLDFRLIICSHNEILKDRTYSPKSSVKG